MPRTRSRATLRRTSGPRPTTGSAAQREVAFDQVQRPRRSAIGNRRQLEAATADGACQPQLQHQSLYPAASDPDALPVQLLPDLLRTVDLLVLVPDSHDLDTELLVALRARRAS